MYKPLKNLFINWRPMDTQLERNMIVNRAHRKRVRFYNPAALTPSSQNRLLKLLNGSPYIQNYSAINDDFTPSLYFSAKVKP